VDLDSLLGHPGGLGGEAGGAGPLGPEACRRLACDGAVTRVLVTRHRTDYLSHPATTPTAKPTQRPTAPAAMTTWRRGSGRAAALLPPTLGGAPTQPLEVGRTTRVVPPAHRVVPPAHRVALAIRDGGCVFPGCARPLAWCEAHHLRHWLHGGPPT
jgi:hypothetical protein